MAGPPFENLQIALEVRPIAERPLVAAHWTGPGRYRGGLPGATAAAGTPVTNAGMDFFRMEQGTIAEYWISADVYA